MTWLADLVGFIVPVVTITGSLLGILIALDQITAAARLRRRATFWREMAAQSHAIPRDVEIFHSLQRQATARVIALQLKPARNILWSAIVFVLITAVTAGLGMMIGQIPSSDLTWESAWRTASDEAGMPFFLLLPSLIALCTVSFVNLSLERSRITEDHLNGKEITLNRFNRDDRSPIDKLGWTASLQIFAFSLGMTLLPAGVGGLVGASSHQSTVPPEWALLFIFIGGPTILLAGGSLFMKVQVRSMLEWQHPRPLTRRPYKPRSVTSTGTSQKVHPRRIPSGRKSR